MQCIQFTRGPTNVQKSIVSDVFRTFKYPVIWRRRYQIWNRPTDTDRIWKILYILALYNSQIYFSQWPKHISRRRGELPPQATSLRPTKGAQLKSNSTFDYDNKDLHLHTRHSSSTALSLISQHKHTSHLLQKTSKTTWYFWHLNLESQEDMEISKDASINLGNLQSAPPPAVWLICNKCVSLCVSVWKYHHQS